MEPIVEIMEQSDYKAYRTYYFFVNRRRPMSWLSWIILYGIAPAAAAYVFFRGLQHGMINYITLIFAAIIVAFFVYDATAPRRIFKRQSSSFVTNRATFFEDHYTYVTKGKSSTQEGSFAYSDIEKVYETATAFYMKYITRSWGFYPKKFFAPGQAQALRELFARKFGNRFITKY